jgi:hypothetical protein
MKISKAAEELSRKILPETDSGTRHMLDVMVQSAMDICHECGTPEATEDFQLRVIYETCRIVGSALAWAGYGGTL